MAPALRKLAYFQGRSFFGLLIPGRRMPRGRPASTHPATDERVRRLRDIAGEPKPYEPYVPEYSGQVQVSHQPVPAQREPAWRIRMG